MNFAIETIGCTYCKQIHLAPQNQCKPRHPEFVKYLVLLEYHVTKLMTPCRSNGGLSLLCDIVLYNCLKISNQEPP
jgi:hypothetical protein